MTVRSNLWRQWSQPYYVVNMTIVLSWAFLRQVLPGAQRLRSEPGSWFATQEREVFMLVGFGLLSKVRRATSLHEYVYKITLYGKVALGLCLARSQSFGFLAFYLCLLSFLFVALPTPRFSGSEFVQDLDAARFVEKVLRRTDDKDDAPLWLVMFYADWCETCAHATPLFCSLAAQHSSKRRIFATVDVAANPTVARRFNIDTSYRTLQLPTFVLFYSGREKRRLPFFQDNKIVKTKFARHSLQSYFLLDQSVHKATLILHKVDQDHADKQAQAYVASK